MSSIVKMDQLEEEITVMAEGVIQALVKRSQEYRANMNQSQKNDCLDDGAAFNHMIQMLGLDPLTKEELATIDALIFMITKTRGLKEETVHCLLQNEFNIKGIHDVKRQDYLRLIKFLTPMIAGPRSV